MFQAFRPRLARAATVLALVSSCFAGCGDEPTTPSGSLDFALQVSPEVRLGTVNYSVSGNGFAKIGTIDSSASATLSARVGGIPQGQGFQLLLNATAANDSSVKCEGKALFNVVAGVTTQVTVSLQCRLAPRNGSVVINGKVNICPRIDAVDVLPAEAFVGGAISVNVQAHDADGVPAAISFAWTSTVGPVTGAAAASASTLCTNPGSGSVSITVTDGDCSDSITVPVVCTPVPGTPDAGVTMVDAAPPAPSAIKINEVESSGGTPGDWAELFNAGTTTADLSNWIFKDNDDTHVYVIPAGTMLAPGAFLAIEEAGFGFGLGSGDSARIFNAAGVLIDSYTWPTGHAAITYGRCPDGAGAFVNTSASTKGVPNACPVFTTPDAGSADVVTPSAPDASAPDTSVATILPWPGLDNVKTVDSQNQFGDNLSGLHYQPATSTSPAVLFGALNSPSLLYRLLFNGTTWASDTSNGWSSGKNLRYPSGTGNPDTESVTRAEAEVPALYVSTERNNDASSVSRLSILRVDTSTAGTELVATNEWNLNADLPVVGANLGLEAITWVPDAFLVAKGLVDRNTNLPYNAASYANHGTGLFFVGVEGTGMVHAYALDHSGSGFNRIASFTSGFPAVMGIEFDRETGNLWAICDNTCGNATTVLGIDSGAFVVKKKFARPSTLPDSNNEGIAIAPESECVAGVKPFYWADDSHFGGFALRTASVACGPLF